MPGSLASFKSEARYQHGVNQRPFRCLVNKRFSRLCNALFSGSPLLILILISRIHEKRTTDGHG
jgi:hypothetical protein